MPSAMEEAFAQVVRAGKGLLLLWIVSQLFGAALAVLAAYLVWWRLELGLVGLVVAPVLFVLVNTVKNAVFDLAFQRRLETLAYRGAMTLVDQGVLDASVFLRLPQTRVAYWYTLIPGYIEDKQVRDRLCRYVGLESDEEYQSRISK